MMGVEGLAEGKRFVDPTNEVKTKATIPMEKMKPAWRRRWWLLARMWCTKCSSVCRLLLHYFSTAYGTPLPWCMTWYSFSAVVLSRPRHELEALPPCRA